MPPESGWQGPPALHRPCETYIEVTAWGNGGPTPFSGHDRSSLSLFPRSPGAWGWGPSPGWGRENAGAGGGCFYHNLSEWDSFLLPDVQLKTLQPDLRIESTWWCGMPLLHAAAHPGRGVWAPSLKVKGRMPSWQRPLLSHRGSFHDGPLVTGLIQHSEEFMDAPGEKIDLKGTV